MLPQGARAMFGALGNVYPKLDWAPQMFRAKTTLQALGQSSEEAYAHAVGVVPPLGRSRLYSASFRKGLQGHRGEQRYIDTMRAAPANDALGRAQYADLKIWLPGDILTKVDRTSMAVSLEAREPLLDHRLVEFAAKLPARLRLRGGSGKYLMKKALGRYLPPEVLHRRKQGFVTPIAAWFRGPLAPQAEALSRSPAFAELGWFDEGAIARAAAQHRAGAADHSRLLWQLLMLEKSLQRVFGLGLSSPGYRASTK